MKKLFASGLLLLPLSAFAADWTYVEWPNENTNNSTYYASFNVGTNRLQHLTYVKCERGQLEIALSPGFYIGRKATKVALKVDSGKIIHGTWMVSKDGDSVLVPKDLNEIVISELLHGEVLRLKVNDFRNAPNIYTYQLSGAVEAIEKVYQQCK